MILSFLFIIGSAIFGFSIISLLNENQGFLISQIFSGWCLGSMIISSIAFVTSYFCKITFAHSIVLLLFMLLVSLAIIILQFSHFHSLFGSSKIRLERAPSFYFSLVAIGFCMLAYVNASYSMYPEIIPEKGRYFFETEHSFISSILTGVNSRRKHFLTFSDPNLINQSYTISALPEIYAACLITLKANYADVTVLISFLSSLSVAAGINLLSCFYSSGSTILMCFLYFFNGGSSIYNFLNGPKDEIPPFIIENLTMSLYPSFSSSTTTRRVKKILDGVHNCGRGETPHYSIFGIHLAFSKISGFSIPLAIFALAHLHMAQNPNRKNSSYSILAGLFASFIPSLSTSFTFFIIASNFSTSFISVMPFALSLIPKIYKSFYIIYPLWREYQMNGIFFSQFVTFIDSIGIPYIFIFSFPFFFFNYTYFHRFLSIIAGFLFICFVREGNDTFANDIALSALCISSFTGNFLHVINRIRYKIMGKLYFISKRESRNEFFEVDDIDKTKNEKIPDETNKPPENNEANNNESEKEFQNEGENEDKFYSQLLGVYNFFYYFLILYIIFSGFLNIKILSETKSGGIGERSLHCGNMINFYSKPNDIILTDATGMNPATIIAGRQIIIGKVSDLWKRGEDTKAQAELFENAKKNGIVSFMAKENIHYLLEFKLALFALPNNTYLNYFKVLAENDDWVLFSLERQRSSHYRGLNFND